VDAPAPCTNREERGTRRRLENLTQGSLEGRVFVVCFRLRLGHGHNVSFIAVPFEYSWKRADHFQKHCLRDGDFACATDVDYETRADAFMLGRRRITTVQCRRPQGDIVRYDLLTREFCVLSRGFIVTYFVPRPAVHGYRFNVCYLHMECRRIF